MKILGIALLIVVLAIASLQIGGIAFAYMESKPLSEIYPWSLPMAERAYSPKNLLRAWGVVAAVPILFGLFFAVLMFMPGRTGNHGSARWARPGDLRKQRMLAKSGVILGKNGRSKRAALLRQDEQTHTLLVAPTGAGKGVGVIIPNLLTYGGSVVCVDVKGENWNFTAGARKTMGDSVYRFSPRSADACSHRWNPLSYISDEPARRISELRQLATYLFPVPSASSDSWVKGARNIFVGVCLYVLDHGEQKTIGTVYRSIFGSFGFTASMKDILKTENLDPECQRLLAQYMAFAEDQLSGYMGSLEPLNLWADPLVDAATSGDDIDLRALRKKPTSIYLVVEPGEIEELAPLLRLFFQQVIDLLQSSEPGSDEQYPVLLVMDEFRTMGKLEKVLSAVTTIRSYGGRFMIVVQGLSNLVEVYGREGKDNIIQNCGFQVFYSMNDETSGEYVRKRLGRQTVKQTSKSFGAGRTPSHSYSETGKDLLSLDEIGRLDAARSVIIVEGGWPVKGWRIRYFDEKRFASLVSEPPIPPLLKTHATLRPAAPPARPPVVSTATPQQPVAFEGDGTISNNVVIGKASDRYSAAHAHLDAMTVEIEQSETSWRTVMLNDNQAAAEPDGHLSNVNGEIGASVDTTPTAEADGRNGAADGANKRDARYDVDPNVELFTEIQGVAREKGFHAVSEEMGLTNAVLGDLRALNLV